MTQTENLQHDASRRGAAIARWDDEGGAFDSSGTKAGLTVSKRRYARRIPRVAAPLNADQALAEEVKILECLGAAVIMRWGALSTKIQRELFEHAASLANLKDTEHFRGQLARFLHDHKGRSF